MATKAFWENYFFTVKSSCQREWTRWITPKDERTERLREREREREREKRKFKKTKDVPITTSRGQDRGRNVTLDLRDRVEKMFFSVAVERIRIEGPHPFGLGEGP